jgi:hypothetical protein
MNRPMTYKLLLPAVLAALVLPACASAHRLAPLAPLDAAQLQHGNFVALREFSIRAAPSLEAPIVERIPAGARFSAEVDVRPSADWRAVRIVGRNSGYVFGEPFQLASPLAN